MTSLAYFLGRLDAMRARGLISDEAHATVVAESVARRDEIGRAGRFRTAMAKARQLMDWKPVEALTWAGHARAIDPSASDAWILEFDLLKRLKRFDEARALGAEAGDRFPALRARVEEIALVQAGSGAAAGELAEANAALQRGDDDRAIRLCEVILDRQPDNVDALVLSAFALQRLGHVEEGLVIYGRLCRMQPESDVWPRWVRHLEARRSAPQAARPVVVPASDAPPELPEPRLSWSGVAGEFLQDHWQKLILCMAVLLIVVSSTVGAHLLLGPRLWSPIGKCALALVYTAMFAAFGAGLTRWGAERAGRMMLLTTLIVVPVNFMLVGETRLLTEPTAPRLALLIFDAVALGLLTRMVVGALGLASGANFLAIALIGLSGFDAATTWGVPFERGLAAFLLAPWAFLGSVWWLNTRYRGATDEEHREFAPLALGLLTFALLSGSVRAGVVLHLASALFSVPVMIAAIACVHTAHHLFRFEKDPGRTLSIRFGGVVLSALAFALALARPPGPSPLFSGNALATALLGLGLYAAMLRAYRQPAYLYFAFGALFVGYFGAFYFVVDLLHAVEEVARQALGYQQKLPLPFKSLNGLAFNAVLALLSLLFARRWRDDRLARHCHYIGVPLSIAACVLSGFEPKAAVLCMGSYAVLYAVAAWLFARPAVVYLACAALSGALAFGSILIPGLTLPARALGIADLGVFFWVVRTVLWQREANRSFYLPLVRSALVTAVAAMVAAAVATIPPESVSAMAMSAFLVAGLLCGLIVVDEPRAAVVHLAVAGTVGAFLCALELASGGNRLTNSGFAVAVGAASLGFLALAEWTRGRASTRSTLFTSAMPDSVGVLIVVTIALATSGLGSYLPPVALAYGLGASALLWLSRFRPERRLVGLGIALAVASAYVLSSWRVGWDDVALGMGWISLVSAVAAALLWVLGTTCRRRWNEELYAVPCLVGSFALSSLVFVNAIEGRLHARTAFPTASLALLLNGLVLLLHTTTWRRPALTFAAVASLVSATYLSLFSVGTPSPDKAYILGLVGVVEALIFWSIAQFVPWRPREEWERLYALPLFVWSAFLTAFAVLPAHASPVSMTLVGVSFLLMVKSFPAPGWIYASLAAFATALWSGLLRPLPADWWMASALLGAYGLWALGLLTRRNLLGLRERLALPELAWDFPFFNTATLAGMLAAFLWYDSSSWHAGAWAVRAGIPFALAFFCLLMLKPYPRLPWVHASVALSSLGLALTASAWLKTPSAWILASMVTANAWLAVSRALARGGPALSEKFGITRGGYDRSVELWSKLFFGLAAVSTGVVVLSATVTTVFGPTPPVAIGQIGGWTCILLSLLFAGVFVAAEAVSNDNIPNGIKFFYVILVLGLWWLGVSASPALGLLHVASSAYFPIATVALALASVLSSVRPSQADGGEVGGGRSGEFATFLSRAGFVLAVVATLFAAGSSGTTTLVTLLAASAAFGLLAVVRHRVESGYATGLTWLSACIVLVNLTTTALPNALVLASGGIVGVFTLWSLATWLRATSVGRKSRGVERRDRVVLALDRVGLAGASLSAFTAFLAAFVEAGADGSSGIIAVGVLLAVAVFDLLIARRWQAEWLVYFAQAMLLGAYVAERQYQHLTPETDALVLLAFGYLDLGVAEVLQRLRLGLYARPTLYMSLILPLLPLLPLSLSVINGQLEEINLLAFFATATFYGVAGYTQRWRSLGYASAVMFNALLWLFWSRVGWRFADHPQFFLIPVGFSAILFAEVNRRDLDRATVNTIRGLGLSLAYLSLTVPVWQFQSFGAWLTLLLLSLAGIFVGIGFRIQSFLWLGLVGFVLDVVYQLGRMGAEHVIAKWAIMLGLGILLILFVALNEKKRIVLTMREFYKEARRWE